ncbi:hypothetical protein D9M69_506690 [compost metagenome]
MRQAISERQPERTAHAELHQQPRHQTQRRQPAGCGDPFDQRQGQENRHRVVDARLDLQHARDPVLEADAAAVQHRENRRRIGRADDGAEQQPEPPVDTEQPRCEHAHQTGRHQHAHGRQRQRRLERNAEGGKARAQAAVEQDHRQRQVADQEAEPGVIEADAAGAVHAGQHADGQEHQQERHAEACRKCPQHDAQRHHDGADQDNVVDALQAAPCVTLRRLAGTFQTLQGFQPGVAAKTAVRIPGLPRMIAQRSRCLARQPASSLTLRIGQAPFKRHLTRGYPNHDPVCRHLKGS